MKAVVPKRERGSVLIVVIVVLFCLTLLGYTTMQVVGTDNEVAGKFRRTQTALYLAQAGVSWGMEELRSTHNVTEELENFTGVLGSLTGTMVEEEGDPLFGYYQLAGSPRDFGDGSYAVGIKDDVEEDNNLNDDKNGRILLRAVGTGSDQTRRVIEVTLMVGE